MNTNVKKLIASSLIAFFLTVTLIPISTKAETEVTPKLSDTNVTLCTNRPYPLKVTNTTQPVKWSTSNKNVVTVKKNGYIETHDSGTAYVTAKVGTKKAKCKIVVKKCAMNKIYTLKPTHTRTGVKVYKCPECWGVKPVRIPALGYKSKKKVLVGHKEEILYICTTCGYSCYGYNKFDEHSFNSFTCGGSINCFEQTLVYKTKTK